MAEMLRAQPAATPTIVDLPVRTAAVVRIAGPVEALKDLIGEAFEATAKAITGSGATFAGHPFARYLSVGPVIEAEVGFPFAGTLVPADPVTLAELPGGRAVTTRHVGPYDEIHVAWSRGMAWMSEHGLEVRAPGWEEYLSEPDATPPITDIYWPVR